MGRRKLVTGECRLCGRIGPLSFEHVPPKKAFNQARTVSVKGSRVLDRKARVRPRGPVEQGGVGQYTLCVRPQKQPGGCNEKTGKWYAPSFIAFTWQVADILRAVKGDPLLTYAYYLYPLRVLKQILTMFFSVNDPAIMRQTGLAPFVLGRNRIGMPRPFRVFLYLTASAYSRQIGWAALLKPGGKQSRLTEISFPPLGYVMTAGDDAPDHRMVEITDFGGFGYDDIVMRYLPLRLLPVESPYPGDYRTAEEVGRATEVQHPVMKNGQPTNWMEVRIDPSGVSTPRDEQPGIGRDAEPAHPRKSPE